VVKQTDEAQELQRARLAATMAHEFNNVLMGIDTFVEVLRRRNVDERSRDALAHIQQSVNRGRRISSEILRFTRAPKPVLAVIDVKSWLLEFLPEAKALTNGRATVSGEAGLTVRGDVSQLNQVLANLVLNARDASADDAPIAIHAGRDGESGMLDLQVVDRGTGIPDELRERIFEPLFTTKRSGTGLGLAVVHQVISAHGGSVRVETKVGEGTAFHLLLPLGPPSERTSPTLPEAVLLVEDDAGVVAALREMLRDEGVSVKAAASAEEALVELERERPGVLILDVGLHGMSGLDLYEVIAGRWPRLPVIFISARYEAVDLARILLQPHVGFLRKPFESEQLLAALSRVAK